MATPVPVPLPDPDNHSLSVYGFSAPHLPSSRPPLVVPRRSSRLTVPVARHQRGSSPSTGSFSFLSPLTYLRCGSAVTRPNGDPFLIPLSYLCDVCVSQERKKKLIASSLHRVMGLLFRSSPRTGCNSSRHDCDRSSARWSPLTPQYVVNEVLGWVHALTAVKRVRFLASRAPNPSFVPGEMRSNCILQRLTFSSSRHDAFFSR